jgi:hypothetical protein
MKTFKKSFLFLLSIFFVFTACDEREFDAPPFGAPVYKGEANMTIQELKNKYEGQALVEITEDIIIKGLVVANDVSGNIYKQIQLQDETGGICIAIDRNNIYGDFRVGQEVFLELKGLYFGLYGGYPQIGYKYSRNNDDSFAIGQVTWEFFQIRAHLNDYPTPEKVVPLEISGIENISNSDLGKLVTIKNVYFEKGGKEPFATAPTSGGVQTESKILKSSTNPGVALTARNSSAANFSAKIMPEGTGSITGVLSVYNSTIQITFRDSLDCSPTRFGENVGIGVKELPWTIPYALENQKEDLTGWIEGYIVGTVAPGINEGNPVTKNEDILFKAPFFNNTVVLAATADEKEYKKVIVVNLPEGSSIRSSVNLMNNEGNLGAKLKVTGTLSNQFGIAGLKVNKGTAAEYEFEKTADGSKESPYSVTGVMQNQGAANNTDYLWAEGYIVGIWEGKDAAGNDLYPNNFAKFAPPFYTNLNLLLAASPDETNVANTVCVQLPVSMRDVLSPMNNGSILKKKVLLKGAFEKYNTMPGIKNLQEYVYDGQGGGGGTDPEPGGGNGTEASPYDIAGITANQGTAGNNNFKWCQGYVVGIWEGKDANGNDLYPDNFAKFAPPFYTNVNLLLADSPNETNVANVVCVQIPTSMRDALSPMNDGTILKKKVQLNGSLEKYNSMSGIKNLQAYKIDGQGGGGGTDPEPGTGTGASSDDPYSVAQGIANQGSSQQTWTKGYIVGAINNGVSSITGPSDYKIGVTSGWDSPTNVIIADSPSETNIDKCIIVNLPAGKSLRSQVNLLDNPGNYKKTLTVKGVLRTYFGKAGLRDSAGETADFILQ